MSLYATQVLQTRTPYRQNHVVKLLNSCWVRFEEGLASLSWLATGSISPRDLVMRTLSNISHGQLTIEASDGVYVFGHVASASAPAPPLDITLKVTNEAFWRRLLLFSDLGFAEAYMRGEIDCDNMSGLLQLIILNRGELETGLSNLSTYVLALGRHLTSYRFFGDLSTSPSNISAHYDLGNTFFKEFLSEDMNYSSAIFVDYKEDLSKPHDACEPIELAQRRKMQNIISKANVKHGHRVLEIGTGWGALAILLAKTVVDCTIDTITLSKEQRDLAEINIAREGLSDRIRVHYMDFRECRKKSEWAGAFDRFVSVEMMEHVGKDFIEEYWRVVDWALKPKSAVGVVQVITMPEARIPAYEKSGVDFMQKWIFPGGYIPSLCFLINTMNTGSDGRLTVDSVANIGPHYARTLREWKRKFLSNWDGKIANSLVSQYDLDEASLSVFKRKWIYYFDYCEAGFVTRSLGDHVITFTREGNAEFGCDYKIV